MHEWNKQRSDECKVFKGQNSHVSNAIQADKAAALNVCLSFWRPRLRLEQKMRGMHDVAMLKYGAAVNGATSTSFGQHWYAGQHWHSLLTTVCRFDAWVLIYWRCQKAGHFHLYFYWNIFMCCVIGPWTTKRRTWNKSIRADGQTSMKTICLMESWSLQLWIYLCHGFMAKTLLFES